MKKFVLLIILIASLWACKEDDDVVPNRVIFTFTLKQPLFNDDDRWIVLRDDETGELIDARQVTASEPAVFESTKKIASGKMTVSYVRAAQAANASVWAKVYAGIDIGSSWTSNDDIRNKTNPDTEPWSGTYDLTINNAPTLYSFALSDKNSRTNRNTKAVNDNGTITMTGGFSNGVKQLVSIDPPEGKQKYSFIESIGVDENIVLDYNEFEEFDKYIKLDPAFTYAYVDVMGYPGPATFYNGYTIYDNNEYGLSDALEKPEMNVGILNELSTYRISISYFTFFYQYLGPAPAEVKFPTFGQFEVIKTGFKDYELKTSGDYNHTRASYYFYPQSGNGVQIDYWSPKGNPKHFVPFSDEILSKYGLDMDQLEYGHTDVSVGSQTYSKLLDYYFADEYDQSQHYEITTIRAIEVN